MNIKISNWGISLIFVAIILLVIGLIKGCSNLKKGKEDAKIMVSQVDSLKRLNANTKKAWAASDSAYRDSLEFERGQRMLAESQKERTENELMVSVGENERLIKKYKNQEYTDTTIVQAPKEFVDDCKDCFSRLEMTNRITLKYKNEVNDWAAKYKRETDRINNRVVEVEKERNAYRFSVDSITNIQRKAVSSIRPKGRLYLSWGVLWSYWPTAAGGGLMYQTPRNMIFGLKGYYGAGKTTIETTINFPLSLRRK